MWKVLRSSKRHAKLGCLVLKCPFYYLGTRVGGSMTRVQAWQEIVEKVKSRLSKWKSKTLSIGGRLTLLKSVLGSILVFHMSIFKVPSKATENVIVAIHGVGGKIHSEWTSTGKSCWLSILSEVRSLQRKGAFLKTFFPDYTRLNPQRMLLVSSKIGDLLRFCPLLPSNYKRGYRAKSIRQLGKLVINDEMIDYVKAKYGNKWSVEDVITNVIRDDLLQKEFNKQECVKDDKGEGLLKGSRSNSKDLQGDVGASAGSSTLLVPTKRPPQIRNCILGFSAMKTWALIVNKEFGIRKPKEDAGVSADVARKGKRKMV
ncbi:hypothetical protein Tco_1084171 [Tanacetum coccineum]